MSSAVADLEAGLQAMLNLKAPGVSGSRITTLTALCFANVSSESVLIQKLYTHFKKAPGTHKLGVLYVIDSVARRWSAEAKNNGQTIDSSARDGTYAAGVNKITELMPALMADIVQYAPLEQKDKIRKLVEIWEKGQTFPLVMLNKFKETLAETSPKSTTPVGTPPRSIVSAIDHQVQAPLPAAMASTGANSSAILAALASMARPSTTTPLPQPIAQNSSVTSSNVHNPFSSILPPTISNAQPTFPAVHLINQNSNGFLQPAAPPMTAPVSMNQYSNPVTAPAPPILPAPSPIAQVTTPDNALQQQQLLVIKTLAEQGVPPEQWAAILEVMKSTSFANPAPAAAPAPQTQYNEWSRSSTDADHNRDSNSNRYRQRSRSPQSSWRGEQQRDNGSNRWGQSDHYGERRSPPQGSRTNDYRERSPPGRRGRSPTPPRRTGSTGPKFIDHDPSIKAGHIKVLSRTLFVGGVIQTEQELRSLFMPFGNVQSCIVNKEKRHAFVKMTTRAAAVAAKDGMDFQKSYDSTRGRASTVRWGVGFGPRQCCDYASGTSIIPIEDLTDADRKWMLTAEHGGTGGQPMTTGMIVEEPDIEIGAGVSSKAISRRNETERNGMNQRPSRRDDSPPSRFRQPERRDDRDNGYGVSNNSGAAQGMSIPGFPGQFPGMPPMPPGFFPPGSMPPPFRRP